MPQWKSPTGMLEERPAEPGEHRVADIAMQRRHRARLDPALGTGSPSPGRAPSRSSLDEPADVVEGVAVVGVRHQHVLAARRRRCRPAARRRSRAGRRRPPARPRRRAMSCEPSVDPLSATTTSPSIPSVAKRRARLADADRQGLGLVQAGQDDRELDRDGRRTRLGVRRDRIPGRRAGGTRRGGRRARGRHDRQVLPRVDRPDRSGARQGSQSPAPSSARPPRTTRCHTPSATGTPAERGATPPHGVRERVRRSARALPYGVPGAQERGAAPAGRERRAGRRRAVPARRLRLRRARRGRARARAARLRRRRLPLPARRDHQPGRLHRAGAGDQPRGEQPPRRRPRHSACRAGRTARRRGVRRARRHRAPRGRAAARAAGPGRARGACSRRR